MRMRKSRRELRASIAMSQRVIYHQKKRRNKMRH